MVNNNTQAVEVRREQRYSHAEKRKFIEDNRGNLIVKNVLDNKTTFTGEIENFYDIGFSYALRGTDHTEKFNQEKSGKIPTGLLEMIEPFSEQGKLNPKFLSYECVRSQIKMNDKSDMHFLRGTLASIAGGIGVPSFIAIHFAPNRFEYSIEGAIISAGIGLAGILSLVRFGSEKNNKRWETPEYTEFSRLKDSVCSADDFIREYKIYEELR